MAVRPVSPRLAVLVVVFVVVVGPIVGAAAPAGMLPGIMLGTWAVLFAAFLFWREVTR